MNRVLVFRVRVFLALQTLAVRQSGLFHLESSEGRVLHCIPSANDVCDSMQLSSIIRFQNATLGMDSEPPGSQIKWLVTWHDSEETGWRPGYHTIQLDSDLRFLSLKEPLGVPACPEIECVDYILELVYGDREELFGRGDSRQRWRIAGPRFEFPLFFKDGISSSFYTIRNQKTYPAGSLYHQYLSSRGAQADLRFDSGIGGWTQSWIPRPAGTAVNTKFLCTALKNAAVDGFQLYNADGAKLVLETASLAACEQACASNEDCGGFVFGFQIELQGFSNGFTYSAVASNLCSLKSIQSSFAAARYDGGSYYGRCRTASGPLGNLQTSTQPPVFVDPLPENKVGADDVILVTVVVVLGVGLLAGATILRLVRLQKHDEHDLNDPSISDLPSAQNPGFLGNNNVKVWSPSHRAVEALALGSEHPLARGPPPSPAPWASPTLLQPSDPVALPKATKPFGGFPSSKELSAVKNKVSFERVKSYRTKAYPEKAVEGPTEEKSIQEIQETLAAKKIQATSDPVNTQFGGMDDDPVNTIGDIDD